MSAIQPGSGPTFHTTVDVQSDPVMRVDSYEGKQRESAAFSSSAGAGGFSTFPSPAAAALFIPGVTVRFGQDAFPLKTPPHCLFQPSTSQPWRFGYHPPAELTAVTTIAAPPYPIKQPAAAAQYPLVPAFARHYTAVRHSTSLLPYFLRWPFFFFPYNVNEWTARLVAVQVLCVSAVIIAYRNSTWAWYLTVALFFDFSLRFSLGGRGSLCGALAEGLAFYLPRTLVPGPPKQFAALCGMMFTGAAAIGFWLQDEDSEHEAGAVLLGVLIGCCALEGFLNFCIGCACFDLLMRFGLVSHACIDRANAVWPEQERTLAEEDTRLDEGPSPRVEILPPPLPGVDHPGVPLRYKASSDAQKREDFHPIRHCGIGYFTAPMASTGLALVWLYAANPLALNTPDVVWKILAIASAVLYGALLILYGLKAALYPWKVHKEWQCVVRRNFFIAIPLCWLLFIPLCIAGDQLTLAEALFWIAAPAQLALSVWIIAVWFRFSMDSDVLTPALLFPVVGNVVAAVMLPLVHTGYVQAAWLWMAFPLFSWVFITAVLIQRQLTGPALVDALKPLQFLHLAAPNILLIAYLSIQSVEQPQSAGWDAFALFLYYVGLLVALLLLALGLQAYFGRDRWGVHWFGYGFPLDTLAITTILYHQQSRSATTQGVATTALVVVNVVIAIQFALFASALVSRKTFVPAEKFSVAAFFKLQHYAMREAFHRLDALAQAELGSGEERVDAARMADFARILEGLAVTFKEHAEHEEQILYVVMRQWAPTFLARLDAQHAEHGELLPGLLRRFHDDLAPAATDKRRHDAALQSLLEALSAARAEVCAHMDEEERHVIVRKFINSAQAVQSVRAAWAYTPPHAWAVILPFCVRMQFMHGRRVRLLQALVWALPEHAQLVGKMVYDGVDSLLWDRLVVDVPDIVPRTVPGHHKYW